MLELLGNLAKKTERAKIGKQLAKELGAQELIIFIKDIELQVLLPAPGFPQTLQEASAWQAFLKECIKQKVFTSALPFSEKTIRKKAVGIAYEDACVVVLLGGKPIKEKLASLSSILPLLTSVLQHDQYEIDTKAQFSIAEKSITENQEIIKKLDVTRRALQSALIQTEKETENRKKAEETAATHKTRLYDLFMQAPAMIAILKGPKLVFELANPLYLKSVGKTEDIIGKEVLEVFPEIKGQPIERILFDVYNTGKPFIGNETFLQLDINNDGVAEDTYFNFVYQPSRNRKRDVDGILVHAIEVTDQVKARKIVEEQNQVLQMITSGASLAQALEFLVQSVEKQSPHNMKASILLLDNDKKHLRHGAAPSLPKEYNDAIDGILVGSAVGSCGTAVYTKKPVFVSDIASDPLWKDFKDLARKHNLASCWSTPVLSSDQRVLGTFAMYYHQPRVASVEDRQIIDFATRTAALVIEQKRTEEALKESEAKFRHLFDSNIVGIAFWNVSGEVYDANDAFLNMLGYSLKDLQEDKINWQKFTLPAHREIHATGVQRALKGDTVAPYETNARHKDGHEVDLLVGYAIMEGSQEKGMAFFLDITQRKRLDKQKDEFIGIASHELKTPLTSVKAYTQVLQARFKKAEDMKSAELVGKMDGQLNKLISLIADLLDITKIEGGKLRFREGYFDFNELVEETVEELQRTTDKHMLIKKLEKTRSVYGDRDRLGQVITNLITNAIKYSPKSNKVIIRTKADKKQITLSVEDFGLGITKDDQAKVFGRFYRVGGEKQETYPGLGLGLYISAEIIKRQKGRIWIDSESGKGATFSFSLPLKSKRDGESSVIVA